MVSEITMSYGLVTVNVVASVQYISPINVAGIRVSVIFCRAESESVLISSKSTLNSSGL